MKCPKCGGENSQGTQFCTQCWTSLSATDVVDHSYPSVHVPPPPVYGVPQGGPYAPPGTYPPPPGYVGSQQASTRAVLALVFAVSGLFLWCLPLPIVAIVLGKKELDAIERGESPRAGETLAKVGYIMGIVLTILVGLVNLIWIAMIVLSIFAAAVS